LQASEKLKLANNIQGFWSFEQIDPDAITVQYTSLAIDPEGMLHIAYSDKGRAIKYAHTI